MTEKQKKILRLGMKLRKIGDMVDISEEGEPENMVDQSKEFSEILEESLSAESKTALFDNLKTEITKRLNDKKVNIDSKISDIS
jgi:hypothetical protein